MAATLWAHCFLCVFLHYLHVSFSSNSKASEDCPVITRISDPVLHGEGPHWNNIDNALYYLDITGQTLHRYDPATQTEKTVKFDKTVSLVVPIKDHRYKFVLALGLDLVVLTWDWDSGFNETSLIISVDKDRPRNRFNDGKADDYGRIWAGTMGFEPPVGAIEMNQGKLYRVDNIPDKPCSADIVVEPVTISNGLAWSKNNNLMYYIDTPTRRVDAFDFDVKTGTVSNRRSVFEFNNIEGSPDGMTIDNDGNLWIACWGGSQVIQVNPFTGNLMRSIKFPVQRITSAVFGGKNLDTLYVTSMRAGLDKTQLEQQPLAGSLWQVTGLGVTGTPSKPAVVNCKCIH